MTRLSGLLLLLLGSILLLPEARAELVPLVQPALDPVYNWSARNRVKDLLKLMEEEETLGRRLPHPSEFAAFVERRDVRQNASRDPWGSPYYLRVLRRTYYVGSAGSDRAVGTADDIVSVAREIRNDLGRRRR